MLTGKPVFAGFFIFFLVFLKKNAAMFGSIKINNVYLYQLTTIKTQNNEIFCSK